MIMHTSGERLTAKDALLHDWMEPNTSPSLGPFFTIFDKYEKFCVQQLIGCSDWAYLTHSSRHIYTYCSGSDIRTFGKMEYPGLPYFSINNFNTTYTRCGESKWHIFSA